MFFINIAFYGTKQTQCILHCLLVEVFALFYLSNYFNVFLDTFGYIVLPCQTCKIQI